MMGQAKWRLERLAGLKCDVGKIGYARRQSLDMSFHRAKRNAVVRVCCFQDPQVSLIERKVHVIDAEEVENLDFQGPSCGPALRSIGPYQAAHRLADHLVLSLGPLPGHGNGLPVTRNG